MAIRDDLHVLTGSYALDAVSDTEREEFERHLHHCPTCEAEVRGLRETAARLALACALTPPARMEQQVLAATYRTRQLPPLPADRPRRERRRVQAGRILRCPHRLAVLAAAASVAAAVALGITQLSVQHQLDQARATAIARVVTARRPRRDRADQRGRERHRRHLRRTPRRPWSAPAAWLNCRPAASTRCG
jgi:anti-sigma factor RsiW